jgi:hypothetical protein
MLRILRVDDALLQQRGGITPPQRAEVLKQGAEDSYRQMKGMPSGAGLGVTERKLIDGLITEAVSPASVPPPPQPAPAAGATQPASAGSRLTEGSLKSLAAELAAENVTTTLAGSVPGTLSHLRQLRSFAWARARAIVKIDDGLRPEELLQIESMLQAPIPAAVASHAADASAAQGSPTRTPAPIAGSVAPAGSDRVFHYLRVVDTKVFPLIAGLDANGRRVNLEKFVRDNSEKLGVPAASAEALVTAYLRTYP